jgi:hypothetical protein
MLLALCVRPRIWSELADAGLDRAAVLRAVDLTVAANLAIWRVGPLIVEQIDNDEEACT